MVHKRIETRFSCKIKTIFSIDLPRWESVSPLQRIALLNWFGWKRLPKWGKGHLPLSFEYWKSSCCNTVSFGPLCGAESHIVLGKLRAEGGWGVSVSNPQTFLKIASQKFPHVVTKIVYHHLRGSKISISKDKLPMPYELLSLHIANSINISQNSSSIFTCLYVCMSVCVQAWHFFFFSFRL